MKKYADMLNEANHNYQTVLREFLGQLLVGGCALLGIQAALGNHHTQSMGIFLYHTANISLSLGILGVSIALWHQVLTARRIKEELYLALLDILAGKPYKTPFVKSSLCEKISQILGFVFLLVGLFLVAFCQFYS